MPALQGIEKKSHTSEHYLVLHCRQPKVNAVLPALQAFQRIEKESHTSEPYLVRRCRQPRARDNAVLPALQALQRIEKESHVRLQGTVETLDEQLEVLVRKLQQCLSHQHEEVSLCSLSCSIKAVSVCSIEVSRQGVQSGWGVGGW